MLLFRIVLNVNLSFTCICSEYENTMHQLHQMLLNARSTADMQHIKIEIEKVIHQFDQQRFWQQPFIGEGKKKQ